MDQVILNASVIASLAGPERGQRIVWDSTLKGFGVRLTKNAKTYVCENRVAGRKRRVTIGRSTVFTVSEARREAKKLLGQMATDIDPNAQRAVARAKTITLEVAVDAYLSGRKLKTQTIRASRNLIKANFADWLNKEMRHITPAMVVQRFDKLTEKSASTANSATRVLRATWNYARAHTATDTGEYVLPENPCKRVSDLRKWNKEKRRQKHLTNNQYAAFFAGLEKVKRETDSNRHKDAGRTFAQFAELILRTGLRKMEAATLKWENIDLQNRTFSIAEDRAKNGNELVLPMSTQVQTIFEERWKVRGSNDCVFPGEGKDRALVDPRQTLERLRDAVGDPEIGFHDLRRTFAVQCERLDISHSKIKRLLNHVDGGDVTMGYLVSNDPERLREAVQKISDEMDRLGRI